MQATQFLQAIHPDRTWYVSAKDPESPAIENVSFTAAQRDEAARWIDARIEKKNLYYTLNAVKPGTAGKPSRKDISHAVALHVDLDPDKHKPLEEERARILAKLEAFTPAPSCVVDSGGGYQAL